MLNAILNVILTISAWRCMPILTQSAMIADHITGDGYFGNDHLTEFLKKGLQNDEIQ